MLEIFNNMAFPLACCIAMGWYVYHITENHRQDLKDVEESHSQAEERILEAVNNNTVVMTKLCTLLTKDNLEDEVK